jgi:hypothetical protein
LVLNNDTCQSTIANFVKTAVTQISFGQSRTGRCEVVEDMQAAIQISMKIQQIIPLVLLAGFCVLGVQTTNTLPTSAISNINKPALLTTNQATSIVLRLVKEKAPKYYILKRIPFSVGLENGHWHCRLVLGHPRWDEYVDVTIAPDGSTNCVDFGRESWGSDIP